MDYRIEELTSIIRANLTRPPSIERMAESINVSVSYLQHLFKRETGISITKYLKELRLQKARGLLETTHLRVKEIRAKVGATDQTHFLRDFKQKFGQTPDRYRKFFRSGRNG